MFCVCVCVFTVTIEMKGPYDYSSPADWPLMMVSIPSYKSPKTVARPYLC